MRNTWIPILLAAAGAAHGAGKGDSNLVVYFHHGTDSARTVATAEGLSKRMLARVGIAVEWRLGTPNDRGPAEVIEAVLVDQPNASARPEALAFAILGAKGGVRIQIFYNRIQAFRGEATVPLVMAHVLVHEITHILEGVERHSETGVMKARWDVPDFRQMRSAPLPFAEEDVRLIQAWQARQQQTLMAGR